MVVTCSKLTWVLLDLPSELHGIGLPDYMTPGPPGQPLLSEHDAHNFNSFLNGFDNSGEAGKDGSVQHFQQNVGQHPDWMMPPMFVGSETSLRAPDSAEFQNIQMSDFTFNHDMNIASLPHASNYQSNLQGNDFANNGHYDHNLLNQLHDAAQTVQPSHGQTWHQNYPPPTMSRAPQPPRPTMRFGSDSHFQPTGYTAPDGQFEHAPSLDWLEAQSSAANTQSNTEPNTQPSSPVWSKKRKVDEYQSDNHRNGLVPLVDGYVSQQQVSPPKSTSRHHKRLSVISDRPPQSTTAQLSVKEKLDKIVVDEDVDAEYDEDDGLESPAESTSPTSGPKSVNNDKKASLSKSARTRKRSTASTTPNKIKPKPSRSSTGNTSTSRVPLTADQKKANHTNSEQRRRDATAKAYADLYDLVPELEEVGKQSTMKKLEIVVSKVEKVRNTVRQLRLTLGFDPDTGAALQSGTGHTGLATNSSRTMGGFSSPSIPTWPH